MTQGSRPGWFAPPRRGSSRLSTVSQGREALYLMDFAVRLLPKPKPMTAIDSSISNGAELAGGVLVFFLMGFGLDMWLGTTPWFMIGLVLFGVTGQFVKMYYSYSVRMETLEKARAESARGIVE